MNRAEIREILPHREPMLLIDEAYATGEDSAEGRVTIQGDEWFLQGHFPENPVVPGVMLCEMMGQTCSVILAEAVKGKTPYFTGMTNVKFKNVVRPGDVLEIQCRLVRSRPPFYFAEGKGFVAGKLCVSGEFSFAALAE